MRFDLSHECGHFILHDGIETGDIVTENEADKFASAFLFPRVAFHKEFQDCKGFRLNWNLIYDLKIRWGMSARAIIYRANFLGLITAQQYRSANVWLNKTGQSKIERFDDQILPENPVLVKSAIKFLNTNFGISFEDIANELGIQATLLSTITGVSPSIESSDKNATFLITRS
jgi:Zn-dependent peptidase ImmA (M78 family)